jgi:type IV secretory pathway VirB2 component (pilin)
MKPFQRRATQDTLAAVLVIVSPALSWAESNQPGALPWDQPLNTIAALLSGPIAHAFLAVALTVAFLIYGILGNCETGRRLFRAGFGMAVAIEAVKLLNYLLPY